MHVGFEFGPLLCLTYCSLLQFYIFLHYFIRDILSFPEVRIFIFCRLQPDNNKTVDTWLVYDYLEGLSYNCDN